MSGKIKIFVGEQKVDQDRQKEFENAKNGATFNLIEAVQDMILLSSYIDVIRSSYGIPTIAQNEGAFLCPVERDALRTLILNNMPLMYQGVQNIINRCSKYYGSEFTKQVEDENICTLFEVVGVEKQRNRLDFLVQGFDEKNKLKIRGHLVNLDPVQLAEQLRAHEGQLERNRDNFFNRQELSKVF